MRGMNLEICHFILKKVLKWQISRFLSYAKLSVSSRHIRVLGQFQINKKLTSKQTQQTQQQTFPSFPHNLHSFPTAKPNATYIFVLILANDELFEFCVSCGEFGGNMKVFVEFVLRLIFVHLKLSQNPYMPTTGARFHWGQLQCDIPKHDTITECRVTVLRGCKGETNCPIAQELER